MFSQELLHAELTKRVRAAVAGLDGRPGPALDLPDLDELEAAPAKMPDMVAIAVLHHFDLSAFVRSALDFAFGVPVADRDAWFRAFTRTVFLAGNPANLTARFDFDHIASDGSVAWLGPTSTARSTGLRRLLKRFDGDVDLCPPSELALVPAASGGQVRPLHLATAGVSMAEYLVHLNHVIAEAVLTKVFLPQDRLIIHQVPRIDSAVGPYSVLRVHRDNHDPTRLRAYASLSASVLKPSGPPAHSVGGPP